MRELNYQNVYRYGEVVGFVERWMFLTKIGVRL